MLRITTLFGLLLLTAPVKGQVQILGQAIGFEPLDAISHASYLDPSLFL